MAVAVAQIASLWESTAERLRLRCHGLTDEEFFWEPVPGCWNRRPISRWLETATEHDLREARPSHLGATKTAAEVIAILLDEQIHHGAEIALLRDLCVRID